MSFRAHISISPRWLAQRAGPQSHQRDVTDRKVYREGRRDGCSWRLPTMPLSQQAASVASSCSSADDDVRVPTTAAPKFSHHQQSAAQKEQDRRAKLEQWKERREMMERTAEKRRLSSSASSRPLGLGKENHARVWSTATTSVSG